MELISKEDLFQDLAEYFRTHNYACMDTRIWGDIVEVIRNQKEIVSLRGNYDFGAVLAPCPKCGSFNVGVHTEKIDGDEGVFPHYRGYFKCFDCQERYNVRAMEMPFVFIEWNRFYAKAKKGEINLESVGYA